MCWFAEGGPPPPGWKRLAYRIQRNGVSIAMLHCWYTYAGPLVSLCWTFGITMLDLWYHYAGPLVPGCYTSLVPLFQCFYNISRIDVSCLCIWRMSRKLGMVRDEFAGNGDKRKKRMKKEKNPVINLHTLVFFVILYHVNLKG